MWRWFTIGNARSGTHQLFGEVARLTIVRAEHHHQSAALLKGLAHTFIQAFLVLSPYSQLVYHYLNVMILVAVQLHALDDFAKLTVYADSQKALAQYRLKELLVMSLTRPNQGSKQVDLLSLVILKDACHNLLFGVLHHRFARHVGEGLACTGIKQAQEVVNFGHGAYSRTRILVGCLLLNADNRTESRYLVHIGAFEIIEEVSRISREGFNVPALSLRIEGVKSQRTFSRPAESRDDVQTVTRQGHVYILQIVHPRATDVYLIVCHDWFFSLSYRLQSPYCALPVLSVNPRSKLITFLM